MGRIKPITGPAQPFRPDQEKLVFASLSLSLTCVRVTPDGVRRINKMQLFVGPSGWVGGSSRRLLLQDRRFALHVAGVILHQARSGGSW